ncbi:hypothetical protein AK88_04595 [Plasmodium fragile]|uniref:DNA-directed DNA polymerase family A palm domain-containing protein n=1 Tax=Plasmodium fragile TaxID=5857 RepID=A0A0D9QFK1_PLAFR|nr:uncharacterized protein AK88_04595 [Plasmodium fragile]KJP85779.1 hypothetical protein AK88_04595 [Plasmodium fragile]
MKLFYLLKRSPKHVRIRRNVYSDSHICGSKVRFCHTINYAHLAHLVSRRRSNSDEASSLHALLSTLTKRGQRENGHYSEVNSYKGHTCHHDANHRKYNNVLNRWKELVKIYISWFPEINEDKYRSKCFALPTYLVIHVVIPGSNRTEAEALQQFEDFNLDTLLKRIYRNNAHIPNGSYPKCLPEATDHRVCNAKQGSSPHGGQTIDAERTHSLKEESDGQNPGKGNNKSTIKRKRNDNSGAYDVHYVIGRNAGDTYNKVQSVVSGADGAQLKVQGQDQTDQSNKREACSERNYFFSLNTLELKDNEADRELLNQCIRGSVTETIDPVDNAQPNGDHHPHPFLFIVYDCKTLIHIFNNIKLEVPNIGSVFDVYILSSLLQIVQRGEKLQNVFSAYAAQSGRGMLSMLNSTPDLELPTVGSSTESHFAIIPPEFSDVISGKYGIFGWGKYQKIKIKSERKKKATDKRDISEGYYHAGATSTPISVKQQTSKVTQNHFSFTRVEVMDQRSIKKLAFGNKRNLYDITEEDMISYCISRNCCMMALFDVLMDLIARNLNLLNIYVKIEQPLILCISEIERRGIFLNQKKIEEINQSCSNPLVYKKEIEHLCGCNINLNSSKQVASLIYRHLLDLALNPNMEVVATTADATSATEGVNYDYTVERHNSVKSLSHACDGFDAEEGTFEDGEQQDIGKVTAGHQVQSYGSSNKEDTMRPGTNLEKGNLLGNISTQGNYSNYVEEPSLVMDTSIAKKLCPNLNSTISEIRGSKCLQTNNKTLKLIVDEIERNEHITERKKDKIKKVISNVKLYRESKKLFQNYIENLPKFIQRETNRIHCNFNQIGASTGRLSCEHPNLQNIHSKFRSAVSLRGGDRGNEELGSADVREDKLTTTEEAPGEKLMYEESHHRGCSRPKLDGENLITFDYRQMELFIMAYLSFDIQLLKMLQSGDVFVETAKVLFNTTQVTSELRRMTKTVIYGILYGQTENGLARSLLVSEEMASNLISNFFQVFPKVYRFMQMQKILLKHMNRVYTLIGRKRIIEPTVKNKYRISMNTPIQGCAADVMKFALLSCFHIMTHGRGHHVISNFKGMHGPHSKQHVHSTCAWPQNARLLEINNVDTALLEENKPFLDATKLILQVHDELLFESTRVATAPIIGLFSPVLENAFYNLIHYTCTYDRLVLLYDYMHDHISVQTYIECLQLSNNVQTWGSDSYGPSDRHYNSSRRLNAILEQFKFTLPIKVETGECYKEFS